MSGGQKPRWPQYFPCMKQRGKGRPRPVRVVVYDEHWRPVWPPALHFGQAVLIDCGEFRLTGRAHRSEEHAP